MTLVRSCCFSACRSRASAISRSRSAPVLDARRGPELRVHADRGEAGDGVHLVDVDRARCAFQQEVDPSHAGAVDRLERRDRQPLDLRGGRSRQIRRDEDLRPVVDVLGLVVVELARRDDFAGHRGRRLVVAEHGALDFARLGHRRLDDDLAVEARRRDPSPPRATRGSLAFEMPTLDPRLAGFTNIGKPSARSSSAGTLVAIARPVVPEHDPIRADRQAARREHELHQRLVHADCRREHAGADVGHVRELEQSLNRAVLAVRSVQNREDDVEVQSGDDRLPLVPFIGGAPIDRENGLLARPGDEVDLAPAADRPRRLEPRLLDDLCRRHRRRRPIRDAPSGLLCRCESPPVRSASGRDCANTAAAEASDTSCSPDRPP